LKEEIMAKERELKWNVEALTDPEKYGAIRDQSRPQQAGPRRMTIPAV
jgi:hypothetical protein